MKAKYLLMLSLVLAVLAFGQAGCDRDEVKEAGNQGIVIEQISGAPPAEVSKGQDFSFRVTLENKGSYDVRAGEVRVFLGGFFPELFSVSESDLSRENTIELKKANNVAGISGGREQIIFTKGAKYVGQNVDYTQKISYRSCYLYETEVRADICFSLGGSEVCDIEGDKLEGASIGDAPIQITSIVEERSGQNIQVRFKIENVGPGRVYLPSVNCENPEPFNENSILVNIETEEPFDCRPTLSSEKTGEGRVNRIISCKRNMQGVSDHSSPVNFRLRYVYIETTESNIVVTA